MATNLQHLLACGLSAPGLAAVIRRPAELQAAAAALAPTVSAATKPSQKAPAAGAAKKPSQKAPVASAPHSSQTSVAPSRVVDTQPPQVLAAGQKFSSPDGRSFSCLSYNVLLPNSKDGWWIYKYYRDPAEAFTSWPARKALLAAQILEAQADIVCLQEVSELSFVEDFDFMLQAGYQALMHEKKGRYRPATFWRADCWESIVAQHKDRTLTVGLRKQGSPDAGKTLFVVNGHLSAGCNADRRMRQIHEALETVGKEVKKLGLDPQHVPVLVCGDFNSQGQTAVRELLVNGQVTPEFREGGDPTEKGQEGKQITSKVKKHNLARFADASELAFAKGSAPATIVCTNVMDKMVKEDGRTTPALNAIVGEAFDICCSNKGAKMNKDDVDRYLIRVNGELGRGSEFRFTEDTFERTGEKSLSKEDFRALYDQEVEEGKFWGVEHDLCALLGRGLAVKSDGPTELRFDYIYFTESSLQLHGVWEPLTEEQKKRIWGEPWEVLPNAWHPSDHLPVRALFSFR